MKTQFEDYEEVTWSVENGRIDIISIETQLEQLYRSHTFRFESDINQPLNNNEEQSKLIKEYSKNYTKKILLKIKTK